MILPFGLLLAAIALGPVLRPEAWARHYAKVGLSLGAITTAYYLFGLHAWPRVGETAHEYASFIVLIGALYIVSGGIHVRIPRRATPAGNVLFLLIGALLANVLGTTGASMVLIRPWIRINQPRVKAHHIVFFIFLVSNIGGCLTPIGDPPLFLGYLKGIPFWWVAQHCWWLWLVAVGFLLAAFFALDTWDARQSGNAPAATAKFGAEKWSLEGLPNLFWLLVVIGAVFIEKPVFLREVLMAGAAAASYFTTPKAVHAANQFNFHPLQEVCVLFAGIFGTMMPALDWLQMHASQMGALRPGLVFWGSGLLSSVLDNAPTYLGFLSAMFGWAVSPELVDQVQALIQNPAAGPHTGPAWATFQALQHWHASLLAAGKVTPDEIRVAALLGSGFLNTCLVALSVGAVFFGAATYIGNGPNFMVKAIADQQKVPTPGFLAYLAKYTLPFLLPMLAAIWFMFLRG